MSQLSIVRIRQISLLICIDQDINVHGFWTLHFIGSSGHFIPIGTLHFCAHPIWKLFRCSWLSTCVSSKDTAKSLIIQELRDFGQAQDTISLYILQYYIRQWARNWKIMQLTSLKHDGSQTSVSFHRTCTHFTPPSMSSTPFKNDTCEGQFRTICKVAKIETYN